MNVFTFCLLISTFIWSILFEKSVFLIYAIIITIYLLLSLYAQRSSLMSLNKKLHIAAYDDTGDPSCYARIPIDLTAADRFLDKYNKENPDIKLTYTIIGLKAIGEAMSVSKKINGKICFGNFVPLDSVDTSVLVDVDGKNVLNVMVIGCNKHSISELAEQIKGKIRTVKEKKDPNLNKQVKTFSVIPTFIAEILFNTISFISYNIGLPIPPLKVNPNNFGTAILTNISNTGIYDVYAPHCNFTRAILLAAICDSKMEPIVMEDGTIEARKVLNFNITFDHRFADGSDAMHMLARVKDVWMNPEKYVK